MFMDNIEIDRSTSHQLAEKLKSLSCIECVRGWLKDYEGDPFKEIAHCAEIGLITPELRKRLISEVKIILN